MKDLIKNLQTNCPDNHFIQIVTIKDEMNFKVRKNDRVGHKGKLICLHTNGMVSCVINQDFVVSICYCKELPKNE